MLKLIHGADFHLDSPFSGLSPQQAARRRAEQRLLLEALAGLCRERQADLLLLSGDLFDSGSVYRETVSALTEALSRTGCPVFIAPGNHDYFCRSSPYATLQWPANVRVFTDGRVGGYTLKKLNCTVWGRAFTAPHESASPLAGFTAPRDGSVHIMALHGAVGPQSDYGPISREEIAASGLDYLALGHVHKYSGLQREGKTCWAYPGCPEGRGFDETGEKGVLYLELDGGAVREEFIPLCRHRYEELEVDVTGRIPLEALRAALPDDARNHIFRIALVGEGEAPDLEALTHALAPSCYGLTLRDSTQLPLDLWARRNEDSLTGRFLRELYPDWEAEHSPFLAQVARFGLAALENGEDPYL